MLQPSPQPAPSNHQIEKDLKNTFKAKWRNSKNPKLVGKQAEEDRQLTDFHELSTHEILKKSQKVQQKIAPSSFPKNFLIQKEIKEKISNIKKKFFSKIFKMIPPSIMIFLSYFLHINLKQYSEKKNFLGKINLPSRELSKVNKFFKKFIKQPPNSHEIIKGNKLSSNPQFLAKVDQIVSKIGCSRAALLKIMRKESGINPYAINSKTHATGLIQFMPNTARHLGTTVNELANMSGIQQLDYVEKFFTPYFGKIHSYANLYLATFYPAALGKPSNFVLGSKKSDSYARKVAKQNPAISKGKTYVTVADFYRYAGKEPKAIA